ncbi:MAG TPA: hypothetical protein VK072_07990 [Candidatus Avamphibacillus sp.]|nr:hypothetical protein [Candidatus Avamphibacillus sp.]
MGTEVGITLVDNFFREKEFTFAEKKQFKAKLFKYNSGVSGIKISNENGFIILLPFQGQQV